MGIALAMNKMPYIHAAAPVFSGHFRGQAAEDFFLGFRKGFFCGFSVLMLHRLLFYTAYELFYHLYYPGVFHSFVSFQESQA